MNQNQLIDTKKLLDASYMDNDKAKQHLAERNFKLDEELSGKRGKVFLDGEGKPNVVFAGTKNRHDVINDVKIMLGFKDKSKRLKHSKKLVQDVKNKYGQDVKTLGHSYGGYLAEKSNKGGKVVTYNKLAMPHTQKKNKNQIDIRTSNDVASLLSSGNKKITLKSKSYNPLVAHSTKSLKLQNVI